MGTMAYTQQALVQAMADLREARATLVREKGELDHEVTALLGTGWHGTAADAFKVGWDDWRDGLVDVEEGLDAMAELVHAFLVEMGDTDAESRHQLDAVAARIVARLDGDPAT